VRLYLSYQRYAILLLGLGLALLAAPVLLGPTRWWLWLLAAAGAAPVIGFAVVITGRYPRKLRATLGQYRRIADGSFDPDRLERYTSDPCSRVVAHEVLRSAGHGWSARRARVRQLARRYREHGEGLVLIDRTNGIVYHYDGVTTSRTTLTPAEQGGTHV
jgi:hypothetical protein